MMRAVVVRERGGPLQLEQRFTPTPGASQVQLREASGPEPAVREASDTWAIMEARLRAAKVDDLLEKAAAQLGSLADAEDLPEEITAAMAGTLAAVDTGRQRIGSARQRLRVRHAAAGTAPSPTRRGDRPSQAAARPGTTRV